MKARMRAKHAEKVAREQAEKQRVFREIQRRRASPKLGTRRPIPGSQEWAETRGDDIDSPSGDY